MPEACAWPRPEAPSPPHKLGGATLAAGGEETIAAT